MKLIICVDNADGVLFGGKRQSRDEKLLKRVINISNGRLYINDFSLPIFKNIYPSVEICNNIEQIRKTDNFFFNENIYPFTDFSFVTEIIIYRWNRLYPSDVKSGINPLELGFKLVSSNDFTGNSHEVITEEVYSL